MKFHRDIATDERRSADEKQKKLPENQAKSRVSAALYNYDMGRRRTKPGRPAQAKSQIVAELPRACADEKAAVEFMEKRLWGDTPCCIRCGSVSVYQMRDAATGDRNKRFLWRCRDCKQQYTVRTGTVFEDSRIPIHCWCFALWLMCSSKKGISALQIQRKTGLSYKSAHFMLHRIRFAMAPEPRQEPLFGTIEIDETYIGGKPRYKGVSKRGRGTKKTPVLAMVERGGNVRAKVTPTVNTKIIRRALEQNVSPLSAIMTDDLSAYKGATKGFRSHNIVRHSAGEYVNRKHPHIHTNTIESFFAPVKRGMYGNFHSVSKKHLQRYLDEFTFRHNTRRMDDGERVATAIRQSVGRRLTGKELRRRPILIPDKMLPCLVALKRLRKRASAKRAASPSCSSSKGRGKIA